MTSTELYQESTSATPPTVGYLIDEYPYFEDLAPRSFYDTSLGVIYQSQNYKRVKTKRKILEYRAKY
jgi:hypothetical protein